MLQFHHCFSKTSIWEPLVKYIITLNVHFGKNNLCYETEYDKVQWLHRFSKFYKFRCMTVSVSSFSVPKRQNSFRLPFYVFYRSKPSFISHSIHQHALDVLSSKWNIDVEPDIQLNNLFGITIRYLKPGFVLIR